MSGLNFTSKLGFGASGIGTLYRDVTAEAARSVLEKAYEAGIRYFDTAPLYGHGLSELRLGEFLRSVDRGSITVSTKVGRYLVPPYGEAVDYGLWAKPLRLKPVFDYSYDGTMRSLEQSANRLGFPDFDLVYIHDVDRFTHGDQFERHFDAAMEGSYRALDELRKAGHVKAIGVGVNEGPVATRFIEAGEFDAVMIAGRYTLLDRSAAADLLLAAEKADTAIVAAGVFNSGITATGSGASAATYDYGPPPADIVARAEAIERLCGAHGVATQAAAIQFPFRNRKVAAVVLGMSRPERIAQNMTFAEQVIPEQFWADLDHFFESNARVSQR